MKKILRVLSVCMALSVLLSCTVGVSAAGVEGTPMPLEEFLNSPIYKGIVCMAGDIVSTDDSITFKRIADQGGEVEDTNTYRIDEETGLYDEILAMGDIDIDALTASKNVWIQFYILCEDYGKTDSEIHVAFIQLARLEPISIETNSGRVAFDRLADLGIMESGAEVYYDYHKTLTRAEMSVIIVKLLNMPTFDAPEPAFSDVPADHWAYGYISMLQQLGIVRGDGEGFFAPEDYVRYGQAIKMIMCALGYAPLAEEMGGYPMGYIMTAADKA